MLNVNLYTLPTHVRITHMFCASRYLSPTYGEWYHYFSLHSVNVYMHNYHRASHFHALRTYNECYHIYNIIFYLL